MVKGVEIPDSVIFEQKILIFEVHTEEENDAKLHELVKKITRRTLYRSAYTKLERYSPS